MVIETLFKFLITKWMLLKQGPEYLNIHVKTESDNDNFQTWLLIGRLHSRQPIRCYVRITLSTGVDFYMEFT